MFIKELLQYMIWPLFILISWIVIKAAVSFYEKKFPEGEQQV